MKTLRRSLALCLAAALSGAGCDATAPMPDFDETPNLALLITPTPPVRSEVPRDSGLFATLVTTGTPIRSPYLRADRFEMRRLSDGALFAWRPVDTPTEAVGAAPFAVGNYFLPRGASAAGLGSDSIAPGASYELVADAGPHRIVGRTRVPGPVEFVREPADGDTIVRWRRTPGAAAYDVGDAFFVYTFTPIQDTAAVFPRRVFFPGEAPQARLVRVFALDSNYAAFRNDFRAARAGISGGWGVFGSFTWADTELPPPSAAAAAPH